MTTNLIDIQNSDVIMATSNMAENHPVGFQWVMKAKERGAKFIHVDPRFTRTSSAADIHVPIRSGTNIAFFGGLINYAIRKNLYFKDYVVHYTNASFLIDPAFKTATDLNGLFTGFDEAKRAYDRGSWKYQLDGEGNPKRDLALLDPNSVFQLLRRHYSRYTPEMVEKVCGIPKAKFEEVAQLYCSNSGPEKTGTITYALNLTQHTNGVENIRALCMLQLLLGNIGRPGGGVVALRGHANVQGATDLELLYHELPGYMAVPLRDAHPDLKTYLEKETPKGGYWINKPKFFVSLLKDFYGGAGRREGRQPHEHDAAHPVARRRGDAAGRRSDRCPVRLHAGPSAAEAVRGLEEGTGQGLPGRQLHLRGQARPSGDGGGAEGDQRRRHRGHHRQGWQGRLPEGPGHRHLRAPHRRRQDDVRLLDLHRRHRRGPRRPARQQGGRTQAGRRPGLPRRRPGRRVAGQPPFPLQPGGGEPGRQAVEREEEAHLVGRQGPGRQAGGQARQVGRPGRARLQPAAGARRQERRQAVHHAR